MADLLEEVDEMMRQERIMNFWKDNGTWIVAFIVGTIMLTAAFSGYKTWNKGVQEKQTAELLALQSAENYPANILEADLSDFRGGIRGVALLSAADNFMKADDFNNAFTLYNIAAQDTSLPAELNALGTLMATRLAPAQEGANAKDYIAALKNIAGKNNAFAPHAYLELAVLEGEENPTAAQSYLNEVLDTEGIPPSLHERARALGQYYALKTQKGATQE